MSRTEVVVVDYGVGNLLSVLRAFEHCDARVVLSDDPKTILSAEHVVLPGVGAFRNAMRTLEERDLHHVIREVAAGGARLLGICLGMQLFMDVGEEFGMTPGLGLIPGRVIQIPEKTAANEPHKIPHIGWNGLQAASEVASWDDTPLATVQPGEAVYFVHSYMAVPDLSENRLADCVYGGHHIPAVIIRGHMIGCQFHPEKSGKVGLKILRDFLDW